MIARQELTSRPAQVEPLRTTTVC